MATEKQQRAEMARQILDSQVFQEAWDEVLDGIVDAITDAPIADAGVRNQLGLQLGAARAFKERLINVINDSLIEAEAARRQQREEKAREESTEGRR